MKHLALILAASLALSGCTAIRSVVGDPAADDALFAVKATITTYADVYQPGVIVYGRLPSCSKPSSPLICRDDAVFHKLQAADLAATSTILAAQKVLEGSIADAGQITAAINAIAQAEAAIAASGALASPALK